MNDKPLTSPSNQKPVGDSSEILIASPEDEADRDFLPLRSTERVTLGFSQLRDVWRQLRTKR